MRHFWMAIGVASLALLAACTAYQAESTAPTVTYNYASEDDYDNVAEMADEHCEDSYGRDAYLVEQDTNGGGYQAMFSCE